MEGESGLTRREGKELADASAPVNDEELARILQEEGDGEEGVLVEPLLSCPHLTLIAPYDGGLPKFDSLCESCQDGRENWTCLSCHTVRCGRYIGGHMLEHSNASKHAMALGYRDLSVWCFSCEAYLDAQVIPELLPYFQAAHIIKFGHPPTLRSLGQSQHGGATITLHIGGDSS